MNAPDKEAPDFEQIARTVMVYLPTRDSSDVNIEQGVRDVADYLRRVWNARGAADEEALRQCFDKHKSLQFLAVQTISELDQ